MDEYLVPSTDEHLNEYLPLWRRRREFLSGFTGSAGDLVVGREEAWLYTDGRYHLQAEKELEGTGITLMKVGARGVPGLGTHLQQRARERSGLRTGVDPMVLPLATAEHLRALMRRNGGELVPVQGNLVDVIRKDGPGPGSSSLLSLPSSWTGSTPAEKLKRLREDLDGAGAERVAVVKLDQIAWLFNLRARDDVPFNPVFEGFLVVDPGQAHLFLRGGSARLPEPWPEAPPDLAVHDYDAFPGFLSGLRGRVLLDPAATTLGVSELLQAAGCEPVRALSPLERRKAVKNEAEQQAQRRANLKASLAKTRALLWLRRELQAGMRVTEAGFRQHLEGLYAGQEGYFALSFETIAATGPHGAVIHYGDSDETPLEQGQLFLVDSGAHMDGGTTDDTRTLAVGEPTEEARRIYTLVLKGHINCARQVIPEGTPGSALDALARSPLWNAGLHYDHGTGHGVGAFLNVHEGPFALSERERKAYAGNPLHAGMVTSVEPGYYRPGWGGVRLENLYLFVPHRVDGSERPWLRLEPLTWIPFDPALVDPRLLDPPEAAWLQAYHRGCLERLGPLLPEEERRELEALLA